MNVGVSHVETRLALDVKTPVLISPEVVSLVVASTAMHVTA